MPNTHYVDRCVKLQNVEIDNYADYESFAIFLYGASGSTIKNNTLNPMKNQSNPYSRTKSGKRKDLNNTYFRSSWEANIARFYNYLKM